MKLEFNPANPLVVELGHAINKICERINSRFAEWIRENAELNKVSFIKNATVLKERETAIQKVVDQALNPSKFF